MYLIIATFLLFQITFASTADSRPLIKSHAEGGDGGSSFDDLKSMPGNASIVGVRSINITSLYQVDILQVTYLLSNGALYTAPPRGNISIFVPDTINFARGEYIEKIEGKTDGKQVDQLTITIYNPKNYQRRVYGPFGKTGTQNFSFAGHMIGFHGSSGNIINNIGVYVLKHVHQKIAFVGEGGNRFDDNPDSFFPPVIKLTKLFIYHGDSVDSIQAEYQLLGGSTVLGKKHGGDGGTLSIVCITPGEHIVGLKCKSRGDFVDQITIFTAKRDNGTITHYGPFGKYGGDSYYIYGNILALIGKEGDYMDGIGAYYF